MIQQGASTTEQPQRVFNKEFIIATSVLAAALALIILFVAIANAAFASRATIGEFRAYKKLPKNPSQIEFTLAEFGDTVFTVESDEQIKVITDIVFARVYRRDTKKERIIPESNIKFIYQGQTYTLPHSVIKAGNGYYYILAGEDSLDSVLKNLTDELAAQ